MKGRVKPRHIQFVKSSSTNWSTQVSQYRPKLFLTLSFRLSTQNGSKTQYTFGGFSTSLRYNNASAFKYLYYRSPKYTITISSDKFICSILKSRHRNLVGFLAPPQSPPIDFNNTALSMNVSAFNAKHSSFQQRELKIRFLVVLSIICVAFFASVIRLYYKYELMFRLQDGYILMQNRQIKALRLSASLILNLADQGEDSNKFLMLIRKPHMSFQNSLVFPGGVCQTEDEKLSKEFCQFSKITAIRQTLEETGILLLPPNTKITQIQQLRKQYTQKKLKDINQLILSSWEKHTHLLVPITRFVTPHIPRFSRFDCYFFQPKEGVQRINLGNNSDIKNLRIGVQESSKYFWATPSQFLQMGKGAVSLPPPQLILLSYLNRSPQIVKQFSIEPFIGQFSKGHFILPGDKDYDYSLFDHFEPQSRSSQQIKKYIDHKKAQGGQKLRRFVLKKNGMICHVHPVQNEKTILSIIAQKARPKL